MQSIFVVELKCMNMWGCVGEEHQQLPSSALSDQCQHGNGEEKSWLLESRHSRALVSHPSEVVLIRKFKGA